MSYFTVIGLILDIVGAILIFLFAVPLSGVRNSKTRPDALEPFEVKNPKLYTVMQKIGLFLLIVGFACQLTAVLMSESISHS